MEKIKSKFLIFVISLFLLNLPVKAEECPFCIPKGSNFSCKEIEVALNFLNNKVRREVNLPPLEWDCKLAEGSQKWAEYLSRIGYLKHSNNHNYGENLFMYISFGIKFDNINMLLLALKDWYSEKENFVYGKKDWCKEGEVCGHYTQLIWKNTKKIGCGKGENNNLIVVVCRFYPPGNYIGEQPY